jgi:hypothetical protein
MGFGLLMAYIPELILTEIIHIKNPTCLVVLRNNMKFNTIKNMYNKKEGWQQQRSIFVKGPF